MPNLFAYRPPNKAAQSDKIAGYAVNFAAERERYAIKKVGTMKEETIRSHVKHVIEKINTQLGNLKLGFDQQKKKTRNMSIIGGNGRLRITSTAAGFDMSLAGKSLEREMYPFMSQLFGRSHDGYKQRNKNKGTKSAPFWKTDDISKIELAAVEYSKTIA